MMMSTGYDSEIILDKVKGAALKVKNGEAVYERDSVLFDEVQYSWPLLAGLLWIASRNGNKLNVIDFGGSFGVTYYQARKFLTHLSGLRWNIVEQKKFAECGKLYFQDEKLRFYSSLIDCLNDNDQQPDAVLFSGSIQYIEKPYDLLGEVKKRRFGYIIFDRTPFIENGEDRLTVQKVPSEIYQASFPAYFFAKEKFIHFLQEQYDLIAGFDSADKVNIRSVYKGYIFRLRDFQKISAFD